MNLKAKAYVENHKKTAQDKLAALKSALETKGQEPAATEKAPQVKKLKADIRKANMRLAAIAAQEKLQADKKNAKAEKAAAPKEETPKGKAKASKNDAGKGEKKAKGKKKADN